MSLRVKLFSYARTIAAAATPESLAQTPGTSLRASDVVIQAKKLNTQSVFIGDEGNELFELEPRTIITLSDFFHIGTELEYDLNEIFCKVGVDGEGVNILRTKAVTL